LRGLAAMKHTRLLPIVVLVVALVVATRLATCGQASNPDSVPTRTPSTTHSSSAPPFEDNESDLSSYPVHEPSYSFSPTGPLPPGCHLGDPRAGVNTPIRLIVRDPCLTVHGIVGCVYTDRGDGDTHLALLLDPDDAKYLRPGNGVWTCSTDQGSDTAPRMVVEIIPQHCTVRPDNCADRGHFTSPPIPGNGQHIAVTGAWVQDTSTKQGANLWSEIHPAFRIVVDR
jgi:hypothetical protein